jgi:hypothetical protein
MHERHTPWVAMPDQFLGNKYPAAVPDVAQLCERAG